MKNSSDPDFDITLSCFEWHLLLEELNHNLSFVNHNSNSKHLIQRIADQLHGNKINFIEASSLSKPPPPPPNRLIKEGDSEEKPRKLDNISVWDFIINQKMPFGKNQNK